MIRLHIVCPSLCTEVTLRCSCFTWSHGCQTKFKPIAADKTGIITLSNEDVTGKYRTIGLGNDSTMLTQEQGFHQVILLKDIAIGNMASALMAIGNMAV